MKYYFLVLSTVVVVCVGCVSDGQQILDKDEYFAPPAAMMTRPGPGVDGPGPGVIPTSYSAPARAFATRSTQIGFLGPKGMRIGWKIEGGFANNQLTTPARKNFGQGASYRLKLNDIPQREGLVLYPTLQVYPTHPTTDAYLSHVFIPIEVTDEDFDQVESNNFVTKVIYLPDARNQELAIAGVETIVSTRLDPGVDPVRMADQRGTILAVLRIGNKNLEMSSGSGVNVDGNINVSYRVLDGLQGQKAEPIPIGPAGNGFSAIPQPMIVGNSGYPGQPSPHPVAGMGNIPNWGMPMTGTPIGLPGPPHLPLGRPASLRSHTMINNTRVQLPDPVRDMRIEVQHKPGLRLPQSVNHIRYTETHPVYRPGEVSMPKWAGGH